MINEILHKLHNTYRENRQKLINDINLTDNVKFCQELHFLAELFLKKEEDKNVLKYIYSLCIIEINFLSTLTFYL